VLVHAAGQVSELAYGEELCQALRDDELISYRCLSEKLVYYPTGDAAESVPHIAAASTEPYQITSDQFVSTKHRPAPLDLEKPSHQDVRPPGMPSKSWRPACSITPIFPRRQHKRAPSFRDREGFRGAVKAAPHPDFVIPGR